VHEASLSSQTPPCASVSATQTKHTTHTIAYRGVVLLSILVHKQPTLAANPYATAAASYGGVGSKYGRVHEVSSSPHMPPS
jgi:hypothetical protein